MKVLVFTSLAGGQGKSTSSYMVSRLLARSGQKVLAIDGNPQADLSLYLSGEPEKDDPTLLEFLKDKVDPLDAIYPTNFQNLFVIPCDRTLDEANPYLFATGSAASVLRVRLESVSNEFDYVVVDIQPTKSQLAITCVGAGDYLIIPCEANLKGINSAIDTLDFLEGQRRLRACSGNILGIIPFRDKWVGKNQTTKSRRGVEKLNELAKESSIKLLPSILESDQFEKALYSGKLLDEINIDYKSLQYPFETVIEYLG